MAAKYKNIKRLDARSIGWQVVIVRNKKEHSKMFSDSKYGGKRKSLAAAVKFRDQLIKKLKNLKPLPTTNSRNKTGVVGLSFCSEPRQDGSMRHYIMATVKPQKGEKAVGKKFRVIDEDFNDAIKKGTRWRNKILNARKTIESLLN